jgi:hypothetical protein
MMPSIPVLMRSLVLGAIVGLLTTTPVAAQRAGAKMPGVNWDGPFWGQLAGQTLTGRFEAVEGGVQGELRDPNGYLYQILVQTSAQFGAGVLLDPQTGAQMMVQMELRGDSLGLVIQPTQPDGSAGTPMEILLLRGTPPANATVTSPQASPQGRRGETPGSGSNGAGGDPRLVGTWRYTDSYVSGDFSMTTSYNFGLSADGQFVYGSGGVAGGGDAGSLGSGGGITNQGLWRGENGVLYLDEGAGWQPYARYLVDQGQMMLIFGDDSRQLWERIGWQD